MADLDIRIAYDFADHLKTTKLINRLGDASFQCLIRLFGWAAKYRQKGILHGMTPEDIGIVAKWPDGREFVDALVEVGFLDKHGRSQYAIHDWEQHQPWIFFAPERRAKSQKANKAKWAKRDKQLASAQTDIEDSPIENVGVLNPESATPPLPLPLPAPNSISGIASSNAKTEEPVLAGDPHEGPLGL